MTINNTKITKITGGHAIVCESPIKAPAALAWSVLSDFGKTGQWSTIWQENSGIIEPGKEFTTKWKVMGMTAATKHTLIDYSDEDMSFAWSGTLAFAMKDMHRFSIVPVNDSNCKIIQSDQAVGGLAPLFSRLVMFAIRGSFEKMNLELIDHVESL